MHLNIQHLKIYINNTKITTNIPITNYCLLLFSSKY